MIILGDGGHSILVAARNLGPPQLRDITRSADRVLLAIEARVLEGGVEGVRQDVVSGGALDGSLSVGAGDKERLAKKGSRHGVVVVDLAVDGDVVAVEALADDACVYKCMASCAYIYVIYMCVSAVL